MVLFTLSNAPIHFFQNVNREYLMKLDEVGELQGKCVKELTHQRYRMSTLTRSLKR